MTKWEKWPNGIKRPNGMLCEPNEPLNDAIALFMPRNGVALG